MFEEEPPTGVPALPERLGAIARAAGIAMCGGNGMGFLNLDTGLRATGFATPDDMRAGPVTFISHSGSAFAAVAFNDRGIGFNLIVSSGQEIVSTMADYMDYALGLPSTRVLALLLETVRDPQRFRAQLRRAAEADIPVVALTVGRTEGSKAMVTAHSGALAGEHGAYEAVFDAYGVHEVLTLDEMADAMELFSSPRRVRGTARGIASVHDSGGERALFVDMANDLGVPFAAITEQTRAAIEDTLDPGLEATNPLDAWGTGIDADRIFRESFLVMHEDPDTAALAFVVDLTRQGEPYDEGYLQVAKDVFAATTKPFCIVSNLASAVALEEAAYLRDAGIPVLEGTRSGLVALRALIAQRDAGDRAAAGSTHAGGRGRSRPVAATPRRGLGGRRARGSAPAGRLRHPRDPHPGGRVGGRGGGRRQRARVAGRDQDGRARACSTSRMWAGSRSGSPTPTRSVPRTRTSPRGSDPGWWSPPWRRRASRSRSASCATPRSGRSCWWRQAGSWSS